MNESGSSGDDAIARIRTDMFNVIDTLVNEGIEKPALVQLDVDDDAIFFREGLGLDNIGRTDLNGENLTIAQAAPSGGPIVDFKIDPVANKIYYTQQRGVYVVDYNGENFEVLYQDDTFTESLRSLEYHAPTNTVYFIQNGNITGTTPSLLRTVQSGSAPTTILEISNSEITSMTFNPASEKLYLVNADQEAVHKCDLDGSNFEDAVSAYSLYINSAYIGILGGISFSTLLSNTFEIQNEIELSLSPNPSNGNFLVEIKEQGKYLVEIYAWSGALLHSYHLNFGKEQLNTNLESGQYVFRFIDTNSGDSSIRKISVVK